MDDKTKAQVRTRDVAGVPMDVLEAGDGPPVLFLHGMSGAAASAAVINLLAEEYHVLAPNHPGYGGSKRPVHIDSIDDLAYLYLDLLDQFADGPEVAVVGCSIGGWLAAEVAVRCQHRISSLVLSTPLGLKVGDRQTREITDIYALSPEDLAAAMYHDPQVAATDFASWSDDELAAYAGDRESTALYGWKPYMHNPKLLQRLRRITVPTLVVRGESDGILSQSHTAAYRDAIVGAKCQTISLAGHQPEREQPDSFACAVSAFLGGNRQR